MAVSSGSTAQATSFNTLKANIQAEMTRRNRSTSFRTLAANVSAGNSIDNANITDMAYNLNYINSNTYSASSVAEGALIQASTFNGMETAYNTFKGKSIPGSDSGCKSGCIGLCQGCDTGCQGSCKGCQGCGDGCANRCDGGCQYGCGGWCTNNCYNGAYLS